MENFSPKKGNTTQNVIKIQQRADHKFEKVSFRKGSISHANAMLQLIPHTH